MAQSEFGEWRINAEHPERCLTRMALPLDTQGFTSFAVSAIVTSIVCQRTEAAVFRQLSLSVLGAFTEITFHKSFGETRKCHSCLTLVTTQSPNNGLKRIAAGSFRPLRAIGFFESLIGMPSDLVVQPAATA